MDELSGPEGYLGSAVCGMALSKCTDSSRGSQAWAYTVP